MGIKQKLANGEKVYGMMVRIERSPAFCIIAKESGLDYILFDLEHSVYSTETLHDLCQMANAVGLDSLLRVTQLDKACISRSLDAGAKGCMVPMTETREQAEEIVHWAKYPPVGERGYGSGIGAIFYKVGLSTTDAMAQINENTLAIAQIESGLAIENIEEIVSVEGIDAVIIGPNDLSVSLGIPGKVTDEMEIAAIRKVADACHKYGKAFGIHGPDALQEMFAKDINLVMYSTDADVMRNGIRSIRTKMENFGKS